MNFKDYRLVPIEEHEAVEMEDDFDDTLVSHYQKKSEEKIRTELLIAS